jgi:hypothetical protein
MLRAEDAYSGTAVRNDLPDSRILAGHCRAANACLGIDSEDRECSGDVGLGRKYCCGSYK